MDAFLDGVDGEEAEGPFVDIDLCLWAEGDASDDRLRIFPFFFLSTEGEDAEGAACASGGEDEDDTGPEREIFAGRAEGEVEGEVEEDGGDEAGRTEGTETLRLSLCLALSSFLFFAAARRYMFLTSGLMLASCCAADFALRTGRDADTVADMLYCHSLLLLLRSLSLLSLFDRVCLSPGPVRVWAGVSLLGVPVRVGVLLGVRRGGARMKSGGGSLGRLAAGKRE